MATTLCKFRYKEVDLHVIIEDYQAWFRYVDILDMFRIPEGHMNKMFFEGDFRRFKRGASEYDYMGEIAFCLLIRSLYPKIEMAPFDIWFQSKCLPEIRRTMQSANDHIVRKSEFNNLIAKLKRLETINLNLENKINKVMLSVTAQLGNIEIPISEAYEKVKEFSDDLKSTFRFENVEWTSTGEDVESCNPIERLKKNQDDGDGEDGEEDDGEEDQPEEEASK